MFFASLYITNFQSCLKCFINKFPSADFCLFVWVRASLCHCERSKGEGAVVLMVTRWFTRRVAGSHSTAGLTSGSKVYCFGKIRGIYIWKFSSGYNNENPREKNDSKCAKFLTFCQVCATIGVRVNKNLYFHIYTVYVKRNFDFQMCSVMNLMFMFMWIWTQFFFIADSDLCGHVVH